MPPSAHGYCPQALTSISLSPCLANRYAGSAAQRASLRPRLTEGVDLVVTSYETLRSDVAQLAAIRWDSLVLDEGHAIRNPKAKVPPAQRAPRGEAPPAHALAAPSPSLPHWGHVARQSQRTLAPTRFALTRHRGL